MEKNTVIDIQNIELQFKNAMQAEGITPPDQIIPDSKFHRFYIEGHKPGSTNGAYILHADKNPAGYFQDFKTGISQTWRNSSGSRISYDLIKPIQEAKRQREAEILQKHVKAAKKANYIWDHSKPITKQSDHDYLVNKRIQPHGEKLYRDALVIPIYDQSGQLVNLQFINPQGDKRFLPSGRKRGCFHIIGDLTNKVLMCEGFATGASLFQESGQRVVIAFDAGNLLPVAKNIREQLPDMEIIICGDNDLSGIGQTKSKEAALAVGGKVLIPSVSGQDWNDFLVGGIQNR